MTTRWWLRQSSFISDRDVRWSRAIAYRSPIPAVHDGIGVFSGRTVAQILRDVLGGGVLADRMNRNAVAATVDHEVDRLAFLDGYVIRRQEMSNRGTDGSGVRV